MSTIPATLTLFVLISCQTQQGESLTFTSSGGDVHDYVIFADGINQASWGGGNYLKPLTVDLPDKTNVLSVILNVDVNYEGYSRGLGGLLGSLSDGRVTDDQWKCTREANRTIFGLPEFDDSDWPQAVATRAIDEPSEEFVVPGISLSARWIWAGDYHSDYSYTVYCRLTLRNDGPCASGPCLNGATCAVKEFTRFVCYCAEGFEGDDCGTPAPELEDSTGPVPLPEPIIIITTTEVQSEPITTTTAEMPVDTGMPF